MPMAINETTRAMKATITPVSAMLRITSRDACDGEEGRVVLCEGRLCAGLDGLDRPHSAWESHALPFAVDSSALQRKWP